MHYHSIADPHISHILNMQMCNFLCFGMIDDLYHLYQNMGAVKILIVYSCLITIDASTLAIMLLLLFV